MKVLINTKYSKLSTFIHEIPERFNKEGRTIYKIRNEIKVFDLNGMLINVKKYQVPFFINRFVYTFIRPPKCMRAYQHAEILLKKGIATPEPIAFIVQHKTGLIHYSYFISIQSPYDRNMYEFGKGGINGREDIIITLARYTAKLHDNCIYHLDYSPGNILFCKENDKIHFSLVDINRLEFKTVSFNKGCESFARLWGQEVFFTLLASEYAKARNFDVNKTIEKVLFYRTRFWKKYARRYEIPFDL